MGVWGDEGKAAREIRRRNKRGGGINERLDRENERREAEATDSRWQKLSKG